MKLWSMLLCRIVPLVLLLLIVSPAHALADGSRLAAVGPIDPATGYPIWYQDSNGLTLELCLDFTPQCLAVLPNPGLPMSFPDNFPDESFWWAADSQMATPRSRNILVLALEAAFNPEVITRQNEIVFGRVRIRMTEVNPGTYTVTHPFGVDVIEVGESESDVFVTEDIGIGAPRDFTGALQSRVGFLTVNDPGCVVPAGFVGDASSACKVTGSPLATNYFRIEGPGIAAVANAADNDFPCPDKPLSLDCIQTDLFVVQGKIATKFGVEVTRATNTRGDWDPGLEIFASTRAADAGQGIPQQNLSLSVGGVSRAMVTDGTGKYFAFLEGDFAASTVITATNDSDAARGVNTSVSAGVIDTVTILEAYYFRPPLSELEIVASSSDARSGVTLTAYGDGKELGVLTPGDEGLMLVLNNVLVPPAEVTVKSSLGGSETVVVDVGRCERAGSSQQCVP